MTRKIKISSKSFLNEAETSALGMRHGDRSSFLSTSKPIGDVRTDGGGGDKTPAADPRTSLLSGNNIDLANLGAIDYEAVWQELWNNNTYMGIDLGLLWPGPPPFNFQNPDTWPTNFNEFLDGILDFLNSLLTENGFASIIGDNATNSANSYFNVGITNTYNNLFADYNQIRQQYLFMESIGLVLEILNVITTNSGPNFSAFIGYLTGGTPHSSGANTPLETMYNQYGQEVGFIDMLHDISILLTLYSGSATQMWYILNWPDIWGVSGMNNNVFYNESGMFTFPSTPEGIVALILQWINDNYSRTPPEPPDGGPAIGGGAHDGDHGGGFGSGFGGG